VRFGDLPGVSSIQAITNVFVAATTAPYDAPAFALLALTVASTSPLLGTG
jgi:hypothetical protein